jgi:hypothetical protein
MPAGRLLLEHCCGGPAAIDGAPMDSVDAGEVSAHVQGRNGLAARREGTGEFVEAQALSPAGTFLTQGPGPCQDQAAEDHQRGPPAVHEDDEGGAGEERQAAGGGQGRGPGTAGHDACRGCLRSHDGAREAATAAAIRHVVRRSTGRGRSTPPGAGCEEAAATRRRRAPVWDAGPPRPSLLLRRAGSASPPARARTADGPRARPRMSDRGARSPRPAPRRAPEPPPGPAPRSRRRAVNRGPAVPGTARPLRWPRRPSSAPRPRPRPRRSRCRSKPTPGSSSGVSPAPPRAPLDDPSRPAPDGSQAVHGRRAQAPVAPEVARYAARSSSMIGRSTRHGLPAATTSGGTSRVTTLPAPITARAPRVTPGPKRTRSPVVTGAAEDRAVVVRAGAAAHRDLAAAVAPERGLEPHVLPDRPEQGPQQLRAPVLGAGVGAVVLVEGALDRRPLPRELGAA